MEDTSRWVKTVITEAFGETRDITITKIVPDGSNYWSTIYAVKYVLKEGKKGSMIIKTMPNVLPLAKFIQTINLFQREAYVYYHILPLFNTLKNDVNSPVSSFAPQSLGFTNNHTTHLLEDLKEDGYVSLSRTEPLDLCHALLVVQTLAYFHAYSWFAEERHGIKMKHLSYPVSGNYENAIEFIELRVRLLGEAMMGWGDEWNDIAQKILKFQPHCFDALQKAVQENGKGSLKVLNHGDCWQSNMMFKYNLENVPEICKLLDFQFSHYNSYAMDLVFFIETNLDIAKTHRGRLIETYVNTFKEALVNSKVQPKPLPNVTSTEHEIKRLGIYTFVIVAAVLPCIRALEDSAMHISTDTDGTLETRVANQYKSPKYVEEAKERMRYLQNIGFFENM